MTKDVKMSHEKAWAKACAESLLNNLDFIEVVGNVKENITELANKYDLNEDTLVDWFIDQMPLKSDE